MKTTTGSKSIVIWAAVAAVATGGFALGQEATEQPAPQRHINIHVIGFDVDQAAEQQLTEMAQAGGGRYYPAENEAQLSAALGQAAGVALTPVLSNENEGNSSLGESNAVAPTGTVTGSIDPKGDKDFYMVEVDRPGVLHISVTNVPADLDIVCRVYNAERHAISGWIRPLRAGAETVGSVDVHQPGKLYVQIEDSGNDASSSQPYSLEMRYEPGDAFELNGSLGTAAKVDCNGEFYGSILPKGDKDWYVFEVPRRGAMNVEITKVPENIDIVYRLYNGNGHAITGWVAPLRAGADNIAVLDLPSAGRFYLGLEDSHNDERNPAEYHVKLTYMPGDDYEPNGSFGDATEIDATTQLFANILPKADHDCYVFEVGHPGVVNLSIGNPPANQDLAFRVYNRERHGITGWIAPLRQGAENEAVIDLPHNGRYYLEVVDGKDDERASEQYALSLEYVRADGHEPNNTFGTAVDMGTSAQGSILPKGDHDVYVFDAASQGEYELAITNVPMELDLHARVYDANFHGVSGWLAPLRAGAEVREKFKVSKPGKYYIEVVDGKDDARSPDSYTLTISAAGGTPATP